MEFLFQPESSEIQCMPVSITDDAMSEPSERFSVMLSSSIPRVKVGDSTSVIINDDDRK